MNTVLPIMIILLLGGLSALVLHRLKWPFLLRSAAAALLATALWGCGVYLLLWLTAPSELGPPLPGALFMTFLVALAPTLLVGWLIQSRRPAQSLVDSSPQETR